MAMADGYAQASGKLTVLNLHVAPGLGNAMGMLYDAQMAGSPILVTAGQQDTEYLVQEPILSADLATLAKPFVKFSAQVERLKDLPTLVHRAAKTALAPPTGPVFLRCPATSSRTRATSTCWSRPASHRAARRSRRGPCRRRSAGEGRASGHHRGRRRGAEPRPQGARGTGGADRRTGLHRVRAEHRVVSLLASALPRFDDPLAAGRARGA
jgi:hypothetical protein